jgi:hypothetical protein
MAGINDFLAPPPQPYAPPNYLNPPPLAPTRAQGTISTPQPTWQGWAEDKLAALLSKAGMDERGAQQTANHYTSALGLVPGIGNAVDAHDSMQAAGNAANRGDTLGRLGNSTLAVMAAVPFFGAAKRELNALRGEAQTGIRSYHGSPHDFDRFSWDKIGTGEGAQAYAYGHYSAGKEGVARSYRDALVQTRSPQQSTSDLIAQVSANSPQSRTRDNIRWYMKQDPMLVKHVGDDSVVDDVLAAVNGQEAGGAVSPSALKAYQRLSDKFGEPKGHMYELNINADPSHLLDWDAPLTEQSPHVQAALGTLGIDPVKHTGLRDGGRAYGNISMRLGGDQAASKALDEAGIPGVKYLDQGSRTAGEGTRNYVVFNDKLIDILRKYGIGGLLAGGAAAAATNAPNNQSQVY